MYASHELFIFLIKKMLKYQDEKKRLNLNNNLKQDG